MVSTQPGLQQVQLTGWPGTVSQDLFDVSESTGQQALGDPARTQDGRQYKYAYAGGTALVAGNLLQGPAETTAHEGLSVAAASIGATQIVTTSTITLTANQYAFGYVAIQVTPDIGRLYPIQGHAAFTSAAATINLNSAIDVALTTSSKIALVMNPYYGVIQNPTTQTGVIAGVAIVPTPINFYGWIQTRGIGNPLQQGTLSVGNDVVASTTTAGAVTIQVAGGSSVINARVGIAAQTGTSTQAGPVFLQID